MVSSFQEVGRRTNYGAIRACCNLYAMCTHREKLLPLSVMAGGSPFPPVLLKVARRLAQPALRTILPTRSASGSTKLHFARGIWCGDELTRIFRTAAGHEFGPLLK